MIVMHNRSTDSPYPLSNNPKALYNTGESPTRSNLNQRLCDLLSASTAAPAFFPPFPLDFGAGDQEFVDGGVTAHNNPALQLFLAATLPEYRLGWPTGPDRLLLVSIGTGFSPARLKNLSRLAAPHHLCRHEYAERLDVRRRQPQRRGLPEPGPGPVRSPDRP